MVASTAFVDVSSVDLRVLHHFHSNIRFVSRSASAIVAARCSLLPRLGPPPAFPRSLPPFGGSARKVKLLFFPGEAARRHKQTSQAKSIFTNQKLARDQTHTANMAAIGSLVFCTDCGNLLETNTSRKTFLTCEVCGAQNKGV